MKKYLFACLCLIVGMSMQAQEEQTQEEGNKFVVSNVDYRISGVQLSLLGVSVHQEYSMSATSVFRAEAGLHSDFFNGNHTTAQAFIAIVPYLAVEPRWYYDFKKRVAEGKNTEKNSANFLSVTMTYNTGWFAASLHSDIDVVPEFFVIPKWGMKRTKDNFTYEVGAGVGYRYSFLGDNYSWQHNKGGVAFDLHLRIGQTF